MIIGEGEGGFIIIVNSLLSFFLSFLEGEVNFGESVYLYVL